MYTLYADAYGWTPHQVDTEVYAWLDPWLPKLQALIASVRDESSR